jgi:hypothetical protein
MEQRKPIRADKLTIMKQKMFRFSMRSFILLFVYACGNNTTANSEEKGILRIAEDTAIKRYGHDIIERELPLNATVKNDSVWTVTGALGIGEVGGTIYVEISRRDKHVNKVTHYK